MPHFLFNIQGEPSPVGANLPSVAAAKCEALHHASKAVCDDSTHFWNTRELQAMVTDETGLTLFALIISGIEAPAIRAEPEKPRSAVRAAKRFWKARQPH